MIKELSKVNYKPEIKMKKYWTSYRYESPKIWKSEQNLYPPPWLILILFLTLTRLRITNQKLDTGSNMKSEPRKCNTSMVENKTC